MQLCVNTVSTNAGTVPRAAMQCYTVNTYICCEADGLTLGELHNALRCG